MVSQKEMILNVAQAVDSLTDRVSALELSRLPPVQTDLGNKGLLLQLLDKIHKLEAQLKEKQREVDAERARAGEVVTRLAALYSQFCSPDKSSPDTGSDDDGDWSDDFGFR